MALWLRTWQNTYPEIDFAGRLAWWRDHWRGLAGTACIIMAEAKSEMVGFVTVDLATLYLRPNRRRAGTLGQRPCQRAHRRGQARLAARA